MKTLNSLAVYADTGRKLAIARHKHDSNLARFHSDWFSRAIALEDSNARPMVRKAFNDAYHAEANSYSNAPIYFR